MAQPGEAAPHSGTTGQPGLCCSIGVLDFDGDDPDDIYTPCPYDRSLTGSWNEEVIKIIAGVE